MVNYIPEKRNTNSSIPINSIQITFSKRELKEKTHLHTWDILYKLKE